jgi:hypothetical protein
MCFICGPVGVKYVDERYKMKVTFSFGVVSALCSIQSVGRYTHFKLSAPCPTGNIDKQMNPLRAAGWSYGV